MRKVIKLVSCLLTMSMLVGCGSVATIKFDKEGNATVKEDIYMTDEDLGESMSGLSSSMEVNGTAINSETYVGDKTRGGKTYHVYSAGTEEFVVSDLIGEVSADITIPNHVADKYAKASKTEFYLDIKGLFNEIGQADELNNPSISAALGYYEFYEYKITFPYKIVATNGKLSKDGKSVTFNMKKAILDGKKLYAYTNKSKKFITPSKVYTKDKVTLNSPVAIQSLLIDGNESDEVKNITLTGEGKHTLKATHEYGTQTITVYVDNVKPKIMMKHNGDNVSISFTDNYGILFSVVDGEITYDKDITITEPGDHVIQTYDYAHNMKKVTFGFELQE